MISAVRLLAELGQISLKAPEDRPQPSQHVHLHEALVDAPPRETLQQWTQRKQRELSERSATKQLDPGPTRALRLVDDDD
jgi:hypothetical protein